MNIAKTSKGFTIIEVVLVLAIAGLIFLMVFVALPALQAGQRDSARKTDVGSVISAVQSYQNNNSGTFPTVAKLGTYNTATGKWSGYMSSVSNNVTSITSIAATTATGTGTQSVTAADNAVIIKTGAKCSAAGTATGASPTYTVAKGTARQFAVITRLEGGGGTAFCQDA